MTGHIELRDVSKRFGDAAAVTALSLSVPKGEMVSLLGPSGCGKTTTLNLVAGFLQPDEGTILIGGKPVHDQPPYRRNLGMVFQNFALFPHLTVFQNVAFGLRMRGDRPAEIERRVREALAMVELSGFDNRYRGELSGGQSQRVALARAIVVEPIALLLDEPFSALDANLREQMRSEVRAIQQRIGITTIFVTHDQSEALAMSDRVVVMSRGRIEQAGTPQEIYNRSANTFVARFVGQMNLLKGVVVEKSADSAIVLAGQLRLEVGDARALTAGEAVTVGLRPESIRIVSEDQEGFAGSVTEAAFLGATTQCVVDVQGVQLKVQAQNSRRYQPVGPGAPVKVAWNREDVHVVAA
jgi:spermidine/putrescine ABC transporter ATP-binding subunit